METVNNITGMYYVLGYPISQTWDGKFHNVRVKVTRPDCEVHAQPGYFNPKPFTEYSKIEKEIHLVDLALSAKPISQDPQRFAMQALPVAFPPKNIFSSPRSLRGKEVLKGQESKSRALFSMPWTKSSIASVPRWLEADRIEQSSAFL